MAYDLNWLDDNRRIFQIKAYDPITESEASELIGELRNIADSPAPFYMLLDLNQFDVMKAMPAMRNILQREKMPHQTKAMEASRVAVIGGGSMVTMGLQMIQGMTSLDLIRAFEDEQTGRRWLEEEARVAGIV